MCVCLNDRPNYVNMRALWTEQVETNDWRTVEATWKQIKNGFEMYVRNEEKKAFEMSFKNTFLSFIFGVKMSYVSNIYDRNMDPFM